MTRLAAVALYLAGLPLRDTAPSGTYELRRVAGRPLPAVYGGAADSAKAGVTLLGATVTFGPRGDSAVVSVTVRPRMLEDWPCAALRAMRADEGRGVTGGMTAAPDTASAGCEPLRIEHDTTRVGVRSHGDSLELRPDPRASQLPPLRGTLRQDTLRLRVSAGPADSLEVWTFVRLESLDHPPNEALQPTGATRSREVVPLDGSAVRQPLPHGCSTPAAELPRYPARRLPVLRPPERSSRRVRRET